MFVQTSTLQPRIFISWLLVFASILEILGLVAAPPSSGGGSSCSSASSGRRTSGLGLPIPFVRSAVRRGGG